MALGNLNPKREICPKGNLTRASVMKLAAALKATLKNCRLANSARAGTMKLAAAVKREFQEKARFANSI